MTPTAQALEEVLALAEKAIPGKFEAVFAADTTPCVGTTHTQPGGGKGFLVAEAWSMDDCNFVAAAVNFIRTHGPALLAQLGGGREVVAFRYLHEIARGTYAMTRWLDIKELVHYGPDGDIKLGPHPDWTKIEYAYATPTEPAQAGRDDTSEQAATEGGGW